MAIVGGRASRLLLADEVGLGKTIQAGLIAAELFERRAIDRVLILTPAGLRDQWRDELHHRFGIDAAIVDARAIARTTATLPPDVNPWTATPIAIASIEFVKRPEVLPGVSTVRWDLVVVDEAHGASLDSDRNAAAQAIGARAAYVLLVTATPHNGDRRAYESLCGIGAAADAPLVFRRTRRDVGLGGHRRVHIVRTRRRPDERRMDAALAAYGAAIQAERRDSVLALSVLHKRALSSASSLAESVERRLRALGPHDDAVEQQLALPLADRDGDFSADDEPPCWPAALSMSDPARERRLLTSLAEAARRAAVHESKIAALVRLLNRPRVKNERVIVFTEYRDTLEHVRRSLSDRAVVLHGGMDRRQRIDALRRFAGGGASVLLATDAAGEGLNLQDGCRFVVNLELPWNPTRLEQRIGRVDRIGQRRRVHACHLVAGGTGEALILDRLRERIGAARQAVGAADPLSPSDFDDEQVVAQMVVNGDVPVDDRAVVQGVLESNGPSAAAVRETERIRNLRAIAGFTPPDANRLVDGPLVLVSRRGDLRRQLRGRVLMIWRLAAEDAAGRSVETRVVPIVLTGVLARGPWTRARLAAVIAAADPIVRSRIAAETSAWRDEVRQIDEAFRSTRRDRERKIAARISQRRPLAFQAGLFDRRAERARLSAAAIESTLTADAIERAARWEPAITAWPSRVALVAVCR